MQQTDKTSDQASGIEIRDLVVDFAQNHAMGATTRLRALDHIDLNIAPGEAVGLVGESGSGKTTLGKTLLGIHRPQGGQILYRGHDLARLNRAGWMPFRRELQMVFQDPLSSFNPRFTIASSLGLPLRLHGIVSGKKVKDEVGTLLSRVGLNPGFGARYPHELSGGQLQRIAIARAMSVRPQLIIADEAVSKLDVSVRAQILNILKRVNRESGVGLVFITHDLEVARFLCDRIAVMFFGRIVEEGPTRQIFAAPHHPYTKSLLAARRADQETLEPEPLVPADPTQACNFASRCDRRQSVCLEKRPALTSIESGRRLACFRPVAAAI